VGEDCQNCQDCQNRRDWKSQNQSPQIAQMGENVPRRRGDTEKSESQNLSPQTHADKTQMGQDKTFTTETRRRTTPDLE
jgi:hypothetical protein